MRDTTLWWLFGGAAVLGAGWWLFRDREREYRADEARREAERLAAPPAAGGPGGFSYHGGGINPGNFTSMEDYQRAVAANATIVR